MYVCFSLAESVNWGWIIKLVFWGRKQVQCIIFRPSLASSSTYFATAARCTDTFLLSPGNFCRCQPLCGWAGVQTPSTGQLWRTQHPSSAQAECQVPWIARAVPPAPRRPEELLQQSRRDVIKRIFNFLGGGFITTFWKHRVEVRTAGLWNTRTNCCRCLKPL